MFTKDGRVFAQRDAPLVYRDDDILVRLGIAVMGPAALAILYKSMPSTPVDGKGVETGLLLIVVIGGLLYIASRPKRDRLVVNGQGIFVRPHFRTGGTLHIPWSRFGGVSGTTVRGVVSLTFELRNPAERRYFSFYRISGSGLLIANAINEYWAINVYRRQGQSRSPAVNRPRP